MMLYELALHGTRGGTDRVNIVFDTHYEALQYLHEINSQRRMSGLGPARASLARYRYVPFAAALAAWF